MSAPFENLTSDKLIVFLAQGKDSYKMKRGSFSTTDHIRNKHRLTFEQFEDSVAWYQGKGVRLGIKVVKKESDYEIVVLGGQGYNRFWLELPAEEKEHFYGCGEQFTEFDLKGKTVPIWVSEHHSLKKLILKFLREKLFGVNPAYKGHFKNQQTYYAQPTFLSSRKYIVHAESDVYQTISFQKKKTVWFFREIPKKIHILQADDFLSLSTKLSKLLGIQPALPEWTQKGLILASQRGSKALWGAVEKAKAANIPLAGVWSQDWSGNVITAFGYQVYWNWQANNSLYPNLREDIQTMNESGICFLGYINTFLKEDTPLFNEAKAKGYFVKTMKNEVYLIQSTTFSAGIIDLTNPFAYEWYKGIIQTEMIGIGMKGWMADFGEYLPTDSVIHTGEAKKMHNVWPSLWAKLNKEAITESGKEHEIFFFMRAGYTKTIAHAPAMWAGDQHVDFSLEYGLPSAILSALSFSTIGIGVTHSDIGGYTTILHMKRSKELLIRWAEMNVFSPLMRTHEGNQPNNNIQFDYDEETLTHFSRLTNVFVKLSPYLSSLKDEYARLGHPIIRPLFFHHDEPWTYATNYAYLYGKDIFVAPILRPEAKTWEVQLPKGEWIQMFTHERFSGGTHIVECPLGRPLAFFRADSSFSSLFDSISL